jgi:exopolysaccharide biosynthesis predicted pyruvyltransferase EpsI
MKVVPPTVHPYKMASHIAGAGTVVTSSLHALIFAHAFGVPVVPVMPLKHSEPRFKYHDYYSTIGAGYAPVPTHRIQSLQDVRLAAARQEETIDEIASNCAQLADNLVWAASALTGRGG